MLRMNRETPVRSSHDETLVLVDNSRRKRMAIIGAGIVALVAAAPRLHDDGRRRRGGAGGRRRRAGPRRAGPDGDGDRARQDPARADGDDQRRACRAARPAGRDRRTGRAGLAGAGRCRHLGRRRVRCWRRSSARSSPRLPGSRRRRSPPQGPMPSSRRTTSSVRRRWSAAASCPRPISTPSAPRATRRSPRCESRRRSLAQTRAQIGQLDVRAPTSGLVLARSVEVGQIVGPGSGALFRIAAGGEMEMRAQLSQQELAGIRVGMPASVTPVGTTTTISGSVWQVSPVIDPQSRQGEVRIGIPYSAGIRPGGFAEAQDRVGRDHRAAAAAKRGAQRFARAPMSTSSAPATRSSAGASGSARSARLA